MNYYDWEYWNIFKSLCENSVKLFAYLNIDFDEDKGFQDKDMKRWYAEPIKGVQVKGLYSFEVLPTSCSNSFHLNKTKFIQLLMQENVRITISG